MICLLEGFYECICMESSACVNYVVSKKTYGVFTNYELNFNYGGFMH